MKELMMTADERKKATTAARRAGQPAAAGSVDAAASSDGAGAADGGSGKAVGDSSKAVKAPSADGARSGKKAAAPSPAAQQPAADDAARVLRELQERKEELEAANEDLRAAQAELQTSRARYFDLYDRAPVGYFSVSEEGLILEANLTAATMLGVDWDALVDKPILDFTLEDDQGEFFAHRDRLFTTRQPQVYEMRLVRGHGTRFWARMEAVAAQDENGEPVCRVTMSDITEVRLAGAELEAHRDLLEQKVAERTEELEAERKKLRQALATVAESEANFRALYETMDDPVMVATREARISFGNRALSRKLGYGVLELADMHVLDLFAEEDRPEASEILAAILRGERATCPLPLQSKNGGRLPVETRFWLGQWAGAEYLFGMAKDLSAEQEAQQRFERLFRHNPVPVALMSLPDGRFVDVNDAFGERFGYVPGEVVGRTAGELQIFVEAGQPLGQRLAATGRLADVELQVRRKAGGVRDVLLSGEVIESRKKRYFLAALVDITARKRADLEIARLSAIQNALVVGAASFINVPLERQDEAIDQALETMGRLTGADRAYLMAYDFDAGTFSNTHEWCEEGITPEIGNLQNVPLAMFPDWVATHRRGELTHVPQVAALPAKDPLRQSLEPQGIQSLIALPVMSGTKCLGFVGFDSVRRLREWTQSEIELLRVLAELYAHFEERRARERAMRELQEELAEARDQAQEAARVKALFLANMSHEIRTPLNAILGYSQIIGRECRNCEGRETPRRLEALVRSSEHLLELINDLIELARSDGRDIALTPTRFDLVRLVEDVRLMFARRPEAAALKLMSRRGPDVPRLLRADAGKIRQVLVNLVSNAVKYTETGSITVTASVAERGEAGELLLAVDVEDSGCGMRDEDVERVFDLYSRFGAGDRPVAGAGLGLPLSRRYAQALGGDIAVVSRLGAGSRFRFTFRAAESEAGGAELRDAEPIGLAADQPEYRILAVDDDSTNRDMIGHLLGAVGFAVETAASAAQALARLADESRPAIHMVLMDRWMPGVDGCAALRWIRALPASDRYKVLMVTASGGSEQREQALASGADGYIAKPVRLAALLEEIARVGGVRYEYGPPSPFAEGGAEGTEPDSLAGVPAEAKRELAQALRSGDVRRLRELADRISPAQAGAAATIRRFVEVYDYDGLKRLLDEAEAGREKPDEPGRNGQQGA